MWQTVCGVECWLWHAGFSPAGRHAKVPPRQVSGQLTNLHRARTCQGSLPDPDKVAALLLLRRPHKLQHCEACLAISQPIDLYAIYAGPLEQLLVGVPASCCFLHGYWQNCMPQSVLDWLLW